MQYNSQREKLVIPEYGRHVQRLITHLKKIKDDDLRQAHAEEIIKLMYSLNPNNKPGAETTERLWNHLFRIADFDIELTPPNGIIPTPESVRKHPQKPAYNKSRIKYRHYGNYIQKLVDKTAEETDREKQVQYLVIIGSYMKLAYKTWNPEHYVSDEIILEDLRNLSQGRISIPDNLYLDALSSSKTVRKEKPKNPVIQTRKKRRKRR
ncbi:MAG: DUF4290 domain-containing protein [Saprospirales bacterium]|nr:MAG: DUF4290 domain-containing protein [Saprospirales bacterium]